MRPRDFLHALPDAVRPLLAEELAAFRTSTGFSLCQLWYGNRALHYEAWLRARHHVVELGLHFEADPLTNARLLAAFRSRERALRRKLGPTVRVEEWDRGWARVWEPLPLAALDAELADRVARRLADFIATCEPLLRRELPSDVPWVTPARRPARRPR